MKLKKDFYSRNTAQVAQDLIGKVLVRKFNDGTVLKCIITETEAYLGLQDRACHSFGGRRTPRTEVMWGEAGNAYIYFIYGMYYCLNAVTQTSGIPEAVLIRGAIPYTDYSQGLNWYKIETDQKKLSRLMSGPGKLCRVLKINKTLNGLSLQGQALYIEEGISVPTKAIVKTPRIGIDYTIDDPAGSHQWPLRFIWQEATKGKNNENLFRHYKDNRKNTSGSTSKNRK